MQKLDVSGFQVVQSDPVAELSGTSLPPSLNTGLAEVDFEHAQLFSSMASLRQLCSEYQTQSSCAACHESQRNNCENSLIGILGDLLAFILDHFHTEEKAMRDSLLYMFDRDVCEAHMEDHSLISEKIQQIVAALTPMQTVLQVRELDFLLQRWVSHHVVLHDQALGHWLARQDMLFLTQKA